MFMTTTLLHSAVFCLHSAQLVSVYRRVDVIIFGYEIGINLCG